MKEKRVFIPSKTKAKYKKLRLLLASMPGAVVAYSGGVDSTFLLRVAQDVLMDKVVAVVASSMTYPEEEIRQALNLAKELKVRVCRIETNEMENPNFSANPPDRCYYCKKELFSEIKKIAAEENLPFILDGANWDDRHDFRPGSRAAQELGVRSPLEEVKLTKAEIRLLSRWLGLPTWNKPSQACLASRFPYFLEIKPERLKKVAQAEALFRQAGFSQLRVRHHSDEIARIEILPEEFPLLLRPDKRKKIIGQLKSLGYIYITLDLEGYRSGSLNEILKRDKR